MQSMYRWNATERASGLAKEKTGDRERESSNEA